MQTRAGHVHRALQNGYAGALEAGVDCENRALDGDPAVRRVDIQVAEFAPGCLHDHRAAVEGNGHVAAARPHLQRTALIDFDG